MKQKKILITPLDWGLGHATRCIPIIHELMQRGMIVYIATSTQAYSLLEQEFPNLTFFRLPSYKARYSTKIPLMAKVFMQAPKFIYTIVHEHWVITKLVRQHNIDVVISDNRYGCYSARAKSIFITHQLTILMPPSMWYVQRIVNVLNHWLINRFDVCWVPDFTDGITGTLGRAEKLNVKYIGMLSRFRKSNQAVKKEYDLLVLLSGPEPQRSVLETIIFNDLKNYKGEVLIVRGLPEQEEEQGTSLVNVRVINHLSSEKLNHVLEASDIILSRSGYTTIMDLFHLQKNAILIPTPGQTEQEYLANILHKKKWFLSVEQRYFNLEQAILEYRKLPPFQKDKSDNNLLTNEIDMLVS